MTFYLCHQSLRADALYLVSRILDSIPHNTFPNNITQTYNMPHITALATFAQKRSELWKLDKREKLPLLDILCTLRDRRASDPHDKIYSALGLATDMKLPIEVDYNKPFSEMLRDVAVSCLHETSHNLRFLSHAGLEGTDYMAATWIPDWLHSTLLTPFPKVAYRLGFGDARELFDACAVNHQVWKQADYAKLRPSVDGDTLRAHGILVDFVRSTSVVAGSPNDIHDIENLWRMGNMHKSYKPTGETLEEAYLRTLVADLKMKDGRVIGRGGSMYWRQKPKTLLPLDHSDIQRLLEQICISRRFITTLEHRYIGLVPRWAMPGDAIFMLKGGETLYVARPTFAGTYHFVGEAYVHGKMDGQVIQDFECGQGVMQTVEFVAVCNDVLQSVTSTSAEDPLTVRSTDRGYGITGIEVSNPYEHMKAYVHSDVGPQMDFFIAKAIEEVIAACAQAEMTREEVKQKIYVEHVWADIVKERLLPDQEVLIGSGSRAKLAGRELLNARISKLPSHWRKSGLTCRLWPAPGMLFFSIIA